VLPVKWVFKVKRLQDGAFERFKARLVVKGYRQRAGIDYEEIFAPVATTSTFRALMAAVAVHSWHVRQIDFKQAFLNGILQEEVYIAQPEGFQDGTRKVLRLLRSMYGLKQAPRAWHDRLKEALLQMGYTQSVSDPSLFLKPGTWLLLYVDDQLMVGPDLNMLQAVIAVLSVEFDLTDMGDASFYVGVDMAITPGRVALSQKRYIADLLKRFPRPTLPTRPVEIPGKVRRADTSMLMPQPCAIFPQIIGSLLYLAVWTRPDISNATQKLSRVLVCPTEDDMDAAYRILNYLETTQDLQIVYSADAAIPLVEAFCDADYASDALSVPPRRSTSGSVVFMAGGPIMWASKTQQSVAGSTMEAEYMAANITARDLLWMRHLLPELGFPLEGPLAIQCDNQAGIALVKNPMCTVKGKHIDIIHHFVRERVQLGQLSIQFVSGDENVADIFTKPLEFPAFSAHRRRLLQKPPA
jgi:histone deacetylase 1/2